MPLFACSRCNAVENTALCNYWTRNLEAGSRAKPLCSECDPEIGAWHGAFPKVKAEGAYVVGKLGYLVTLEEAEREKWAEDAAKSAKETEHIGLASNVKCAFERGWNYGVHYALGKGKPGQALRALAALVEESLAIPFTSDLAEWVTCCERFRERAALALAAARQLVPEEKKTS